MIDEQERKAQVLKFTSVLQSAGIAVVTVSYYGDGDEGRAEPLQFQDSDANPIDDSNLPRPLDVHTLSDLLEGFAPNGYEDGDGGHGTVTFDVRTGKIRIEHNWYELVSNPADR